MASNVVNTHKMVFSLNPSIIPIAKKLIYKNPGIYKGNLTYWIKEKIPKIVNTEIELAFLQLLKEGYLFTINNCIFPPNKVNQDEKVLIKFAHKYRLSDLDFAILFELNKIGKSSKLNSLSRIIVSKNWHDNESEVKILIQNLFWKNIIIEENGSIVANWKLIMEVLE